MQLFVIISNAGIKINVDVNVKNWLCMRYAIEGVCDKGFIWNPSNCECECNKS